MFKFKLFLKLLLNAIHLWKYFIGGVIDAITTDFATEILFYRHKKIIIVYYPQLKYL